MISNYISLINKHYQESVIETLITNCINVVLVYKNKSKKIKWNMLFILYIYHMQDKQC